MTVDDRNIYYKEIEKLCPSSIIDCGEKKCFEFETFDSSGKKQFRSILLIKIRLHLQSVKKVFH